MARRGAVAVAKSNAVDLVTAETSGKASGASPVDLLEGLWKVIEFAAEVRTLPSAEHRPWPLPTEPWIMAQTWRTLLFAHWPVPADALRRLLPRSLPLDTFDGTAWLSITPFVVEGLRPRGMPAVPGLSAFPELNVRTYVQRDDKPGVFFFSLDAGSRLAVAAARRLYALPYFHARMRATRSGSSIDYGSERIDSRAAPAACDATFRPIGPVQPARPGSLTAWLTERYCLYAVDGAHSLYRAEIHHRPWALHDAAAEVRRNTMAEPLGLTLPEVAPLLHFSERLDVHVWAPRLVERAPGA